MTRLLTAAAYLSTVVAANWAVAKFCSPGWRSPCGTCCTGWRAGGWCWPRSAWVPACPSWSLPRPFIAAVDRLAETGPPATPESPPAAEQATPAPQDTTGAVDNFSRVVDNGWGEGIWEDIGRTGLSAEQEIRKAAAELWLQDGFEPPRWKLGDWCAWIRDGRTPDEACGRGFADPTDELRQP